MNGRVPLRESARKPVPGSRGGQAVPAWQVVEVALLLRVPEGAPPLMETARQIAAATVPPRDKGKGGQGPGVAGQGETKEQSAKREDGEGREEKGEDRPGRGDRRKPHWTREKYAATYSASHADIDAVTHCCRRYGLTVLDVNRLTRVIRVSGNVGAMQAMFGVSLQHFVAQGQSYVSHTDDIQVPAEIGDAVQWVFGLSTFPRAGNGRYRQSHSMCSGAAAPWKTYTPPEFADFYEFPPEQGEGQCIGVLTLYGGFHWSDMKHFFSDLGMPMPDIRTVGPNIPASGEDVWSNFEVTMDTQIVASCAPKARTVVYFSGATSDADTNAWTYYDMLCMALFDFYNKPSVLTMSWGLPERIPGIWTYGEAYVLNELLSVAAILGITICVASGDSGGIWPVDFGMFSAPSLTIFPGSSTWVLNIGGTTLELSPTGQVQNEVVWNRLAEITMLGFGTDPGLMGHLGSSTGGVSSYFERPWWQDVADVPEKTVCEFRDFTLCHYNTFAGRGCPDVSANADFWVGYRIFWNGCWRAGGGTSGASPLIAALMGRLNQGVGFPLGFVNPLFYYLQIDRGTGMFKTITEGNNGAYAAAPGKLWNGATGLGVPRGQAMLAEIKSFFGI